MQVFAAGRDVGGGDAVPDRGRVGARVSGERGGGDGEEQGRQDRSLVQGQLKQGKSEGVTMMNPQWGSEYATPDEGNPTNY